MKKVFSSGLMSLTLATAFLSGLASPAVLAQEAEPKAPEAAKTDSKKQDPDLAASVNPDDPNAAKIYIIPVKGEFGWDFSYDAVKDILEDARKVQPDVIVLRIDARFVGARGGEGNVFNPRDAMKALQTLDVARSISLELTDGIRDDKAWVKKPKLVGWVKKALGAPGYLPFVCPDIYFTSDGMHGGIGYLDLAFGNMMDMVVREKLRGAFLGRAQGLAIKGGHDPRILTAMARVDYVLSYNLVGGKPVFFENDKEGEIVLTDDGDPEAGRADSIDDSIRFKGNDLLILNSETAKKIAFANGTADTLADLAYELGISRAYRVYSTTAEKVLRDHTRTLARMDARYEELEREAPRIWQRAANGETMDERNRERGRAKRMFEEMNAILGKHSEIALQRGGYDALVTENKRAINAIDQEMRLDRNAPRRR